ncbi:RagB/SusD family nutrient uptake outer membrane protein [Niabella drilacis]|uniref:Starch-binding associating with outer membrane n=1 Tax=Niabella drilacis (strain DSM 25811 / CCM 8410 / CCUG 62505 / LMG 26954 / E90) TaxID=1285928 RepID=A0A1G6R714_NIADE|nr:RagB/SusD family nutrient uptake outer membrane protein [Niabella drilacis]SDD00440.1 Starch-binding associating with outer membrane [Niabella drilacis]
MNIHKKIVTGCLAVLLATAPSCVKKYLDIIPDNIADLDNAFTMRVTAERFLLTCYSYMPPEANVNSSYGLMTADELWAVDVGAEAYSGNSLKIAKGYQGIVEPYLNYWDGAQDGVPLFRAIRECNIFLENIGRVPDMDDLEKARWAGEVKFLKAYYHFLLLRMYGPIPIIDVNLPISASVDEVKVYQQPADDCFDYIVKLMDEAAESLPDVITELTQEKGRIDKCVAKSLKAYVLVYAASPLFNGNADYAGMVSKEGKGLFSPSFDKNKWVKAAAACRDAVQFCQANGFVLHRFLPSPVQTFSASLVNQLSFREALTERTNQEAIWVNNKAVVGGGRNEQPFFIARGVVGSNTGGTTGNLAVPLKLAEAFYTSNGVPLDEDKTRNYGARYNLRLVTPGESTNLINGYMTADLNFDREDRFYSTLGFDGGKLFGQGRTAENNQFDINMRYGQSGGIYRNDNYVLTGYFPKKLINYQTILNASSATARNYAWPVMRLANLYLLCAEAINEAEGPNDEAIALLDLVRARSGVKGVKECWNGYSRYPGKYQTQEGLRDIIRGERTIELMLEGQRTWDLRRWKTATTELNAPVMGWSVFKKTEAEYYVPTPVFDQHFLNKNYFWPIKENTLEVNHNLVQTPGW